MAAEEPTWATRADATFPGAGKVGLWTKADSVTTFDDLKIEVLDEHREESW